MQMGVIQQNDYLMRAEFKRNPRVWIMFRQHAEKTT